MGAKASPEFGDLERRYFKDGRQLESAIAELLPPDALLQVDMMHRKVQTLAMAKLIYTGLMSLDGYIADKNGNFDWAEPDEEVHSFVNELARDLGTYLYGRRIYEVMAVWQTLPTHDQPSFIADFANIWRAADKVVYSRTLKTASTPRTHIEQHFEAESVQRLKASAARDLAVGGPTLAAHAFKAGLVDVCHLFIAPIMVGDGNRAFPSDIRLELALQDERRFRNGMVYLHYRSSTSRAT